MTYLVYTLFAQTEPFVLPSCRGIDQQPLTIIHAPQKINVTVSQIATDLSNEVAILLNYSQIIESLHQQYSVIPMRYGCLFKRESEIRHWIAHNTTTYQNLLEKTRDCVEIGIRMLPHHCPPSRLGHAENGKDYLKTRQQLYFAQDQLVSEQEKLIKMLYHQLSSYIKDSKQEYHPVSHLVSLYFLVPRIHIQAFRAIFAQFENHATMKLLMSGPWAPYNFVN